VPERNDGNGPDKNENPDNGDGDWPTLETTPVPLRPTPTPPPRRTNTLAAGSPPLPGAAPPRPPLPPQVPQVPPRVIPPSPPIKPTASPALPRMGPPPRPGGTAPGAPSTLIGIPRTPSGTGAALPFAPTIMAQAPVTLPQGAPSPPAASATASPLPSNAPVVVPAPSATASITGSMRAAVTPTATPAAAPAKPAAMNGDRTITVASQATDDSPATIPGQLRLRATRLRESDPIGAARALVELGLYEERVAQDRGAARSAYEGARAISRTLEPALGRIRRLLEGHRELAQALAILEDELAVAEGSAHRADLFAEKARIHDALGQLAESRAAYAEALRLVPLHAASLRGLEAVVRRELATKPDRALAAVLATHLERLADAYAPPSAAHAASRDGDGRLAAWIHVERADVLDRQLGQPDAAFVALQRAVAFEPAPGPVRGAFTRHLVRHHRTAELVESLATEADHERDDDRASRLLYTAARVLVDKLGTAVTGEGSRAERATMAVDASGILSRASARAPEATPTASRILGELIRLLESVGEIEAASSVRQKRLGLLASTEAKAHEHVRLLEIFDGLGRADESAFHAERALELDPDDASTRERLDRALQRLGRHEVRVRSWVAEANATRPTRVRVAALLRASDITERQLRRRDEAIAHLRAAWAIDPGNSSVFDALSALLSPPARDPDTDARGVRARIELYAQAAQAEADPERRIGLHEKLASIWEDELVQPGRAIEEIEKILALAPERRSAILALQRNAQRAGDAKQLARALQAEADLTSDPPLQRKLLLRAAEVMSDRVGDRDRAFALVERALGIGPDNPEALRARYRLLEKASRYDEARRTLLALIGGEADDARRFALWLEVAILDEQRLKHPYDAVEAYSQAALIRPRHPLPQNEVARLLRAEENPAKLVEALLLLAGSAADAAEYARLLFQAAELQELMLDKDAAALKCLAQSDSLGDEVPKDPAVLEAMERIHIRRNEEPQLAALYGRWLERQPPATVDHNVRVALAAVLAESTPKDAVDLLEGLVAVVPSHVPALRLLEQLHRRLGAHTALAVVLRAEADVFGSNLARSGALWELVALEEQLGPSATLEALARLVEGAPHDTAALDATVRIAGKITSGINVPHPAALATRARLVPAIRARKELAVDPVTRAVYQVEEALLIEAHAPDDVASLRAALAGYHAAIAQWPESLLAARGLERLAERLGERSSLILSQLVLAKLAHGPREKAVHVVRAAELTATDTQPKAQADALALYEEALFADADSLAAGRALAHMLANDIGRLLDRLGDALARATAPDPIHLLGTEIGRAVLRQREAAARAPSLGGAAALPELSDPGIGVSAMRRVLEVAPHDVPSLLQMARLLVLQHVWAEARDTLLHVRELTAEAEPQITAGFMLADLYEGPLADLDLAQSAIESILEIDEENRRALERLHGVAALRGDHALGIKALKRLAEVTLDPAGRVEIDLRLAEACREANDAPGRVHAYCDAIATAPNDQRPWAALARLYRVETPDGAAGYAQALQQLLDVAGARRLPLDHRWLTTLGLIEVNVLVRAREGVAHLQQATMLPGAPAEAKIALGRGLEGAGRNTEATQVLRDVLLPDPETFARTPDLLVGLTTLESALAKDGRAEERAAVEEVRACLGDVKPDRLARLRARRLPEGAPYIGILAGAEMSRLLLPEARSPMIDVGIAMAPIAAKVLRFELGNLNVTSRDRLNPRDNHPTRLLADRLARALGVEAFELYLSPSWQGAARVYPGDPPSIVGSSTFADLPEPEQAFALARLLARTSLGLTWLDELPVDAVDGLLMASIRAVEPTFGSGELTAPREAMAQSFLVSVQKAIGRRQRKLLEEIAPTVVASYDARAFSIGIRRSEYRLGYILSGDLVAAIDYLKRYDREISRADGDPRVLLQHPVTNELLRYALTPEAFAERRRVGAIVTQ
jgi:cellulose synthase operon protein C